MHTQLEKKSQAAGFCEFQQDVTQELGKTVFCTKKTPEKATKQPTKKAIVVNRPVKENIEAHPKIL